MAACVVHMADNYHLKFEWCKANFGKPVKGGHWWRNLDKLYFKNEMFYQTYLLRWA